MTEDMTQFLLDQFEIMAEAPGGVQRLRELILQLAVTGRLGTGDEKDEPASSLFSRIQKDLSSEKSVKENRKSSNLTEQKSGSENVPIIPNNWLLCRLDSLCIKITDGEHFSPISEKSGVPFLSAKDVRENYLDFSNITYVSEDYAKESRKRCDPEKGDLLVVSRGAGIGRTCIIDMDTIFCLLGSVILLKIHRSLYPKYILYALKTVSIKEQLMNLSGSTAQQAIYIRDIKKAILPLPPLIEQQRIVEKVDSLMALCDDLEAKQTRKHTHLVRLGTGSLTALQQSNTQEELGHWWGHLQDNFGLLFDCVENVETLRQTILQLAVTGRLGTGDERDEPASELICKIIEEKSHLIDSGVIGRTKPVPDIDSDDIPYKVPINWKWVRLDNLTYISTGSTPSTTNPDYYHNGIVPWVTSSLTSKDDIYTADKKITQKAVNDCSLKVYPIGTLLVALYGQGKTRGQVSELKIESTINQACAAICFFDVSKEIKDYVKIFLKGNYYSIRSISAGGAQPNLNLNKIKRMLIPLPPLTEQQRIVEKINQLLSICDLLEQGMRRKNKSAISLSNATIQQIIGVV